MPELLKLDMHVHSTHSRDSIFNLNGIFKKFKKTKILPMICDHNSIKGSIEFGKLLKQHNLDYPIIYSEEIETTDGEIIGMFISENIKQGQSVGETLDEIHDQDGFAIVPHPFDELRSTALKTDTMTEHITDINFIEGYNARNIHHNYNTKAIFYAHTHHKPITCGSDSHTYYEFGKTYIELPWFIDQQEFLKSFDTPIIHYYPAHPLVHVLSKSLKICRKLKLM